ncbi:Cell wall beta-glucan synthesis protein [Penicillium ucsense]|uniref:Cell wall beta-glucan synthesis protein n=1 Tax=Penicillium ucsense TaxID=2839758 RepID=A0A8J8WM63_9EURO|nr:Cell wall beta-glucan synthesis protein [Penicillium ucsense]KAF7734654.1 Cell wall beta-glucan synthesis protein [Penicillium ucsense]
MRMSFVSSVVAFTAATSAILVTYPPKGAKIDLGQPLTIKWDAVETDPAKFDLYVVNQAVNPSVTTLIASGVDTTNGSYTIPANDASLTGTDTGGGYQIDFKSTSSGGILAQSQQFKVTGGVSESSSASSSASNSSTTLTSTTTSTSTSTSRTTSLSTTTSTSTETTTSTSTSKHTKTMDVTSTSSTSMPSTSNAAGILVVPGKAGSLLLGLVALAL